MLTYNALFNFIIGNRGSGKTYGAKKQAIKGFLKNKSEFIYIRRYKEELKKITQFFDDIRHEFPEHKFEVKGRKFYIDGVYAGQAISLSTSKIEKSNPFPNVKMIIFDEFIIDKGTYHYLPDEVVCFLELYETIARMRDDCRVFFLSNAITQTNPYFLYFKLELPRAKNNIIRKGEILLELVESEDFIAAKKKTRFGSIIDGTAYGDYAIENAFLRDNDTFIAKKSGTARYYCTLIFKGYKLGLWSDMGAGLFFCSFDIDPSNTMTFSLTQDDHNPNTMLIKRMTSTNYIKFFIMNYKQGNVRFETMQVKNLMQEVIGLMLF